ncbi:MAG: oligosaccharide flippase family protein [Bacteroidetes bacterium]|nr:oligosaccharide flippase family protein [Bacteroidota bacterium]
MRRFFARNLLFIIGINILVKPIWVFLIDRTVQNRVGHEAYGTFQALLNMSVILQFVLDFGLNSYNTRTIAQSPKRFASRFPVMLGLRLLLMGIYSIAVLVLGYLLGYRGEELGLLCGTLLIQTLTILLLFVRSNVAAFQEFKLDGILSVLDRLLMILVCSLLLFLPSMAGQFEIKWFVWTQVACYAVAVLVGFYFLYTITKQPIRLSFHFGKVWGLLRASSPYALLIFLMAVYMRSDTTLVERLSSKDQAGIYASAYRQLDVCNMFAILFAGVLLPLYGRMLAEKKSVAGIVRMSTNLLFPVAVLGAVVAWTCGEGIMQLLYPGAGSYDALVFAWVMTCLPAYSLMYIYSTLLTANGDMKTQNWLAAAAVLLNVGLNLLLVPQYGALAAAIVAAITQWSIAVSTVMITSYKQHLPVHPRWVMALGGYVLLLTAAGISGKLFFDLHWFLLATLLVLLAGLLILTFRFIRLRELLLLFANR